MNKKRGPSPWLIGTAILLSLIGAARAAASSSASELLYEAYHEMLQADELGLEVRIALFSEETQDRPAFTTRAALYKNGSRLRKEIEGITYLYTPEATLVISDREKTITYSPPQPMPIASVPLLDQEAFDRWLGNPDRLTYLGESEDGLQIRIFIHAQGIEHADLYLDPQSKRMMKLVYLYQTEGGGPVRYASLSYQWISLGQDKKTLFDITRFIKQEDGRFTVAPEYRMYQLIEERDLDLKK